MALLMVTCFVEAGPCVDHAFDPHAVLVHFSILQSRPGSGLIE